MTPTARTLAALRSAGFIVETVERWITFPGVPTNGRPIRGIAAVKDRRIRRDLYGLADVESFSPGPTGVLYIQACAASGLAERVKRVLEAPKAADLVSDPNRRLQVWGWRLGGPRGERKVWRVTIVGIHPAGGHAWRHPLHDHLFALGAPEGSPYGPAPGCKACDAAPGPEAPANGKCVAGMPVTVLARDVKHLLLGGSGQP